MAAASWFSDFLQDATQVESVFHKHHGAVSHCSEQNGECAVLSSPWAAPWLWAGRRQGSNSSPPSMHLLSLGILLFLQEAGNYFDGASRPSPVQARLLGPSTPCALKLTVLSLSCWLNLFYMGGG